MKLHFLFSFISLIILACQSNSDAHNKPQPKVQIDTPAPGISEADYRDSLRNAKVDTSTLEGKVQFMKNQVNSELILTHIEHDTMFDFNYDGYNDIFFRYYGASGNFMKYSTVVCIYNPQGNYFYTNEDLRFPNASFFIKKKKFTSFYGSDVKEYHWIDREWKLFMDADYSEEKDKWILNYPILNETKTAKFEGVDNPGNIIEMDIFYQTQ